VVLGPLRRVHAGQSDGDLNLVSDPAFLEERHLSCSFLPNNLNRNRCRCHIKMVLLDSIGIGFALSSSTLAFALAMFVLSFALSRIETATGGRVILLAMLVMVMAMLMIVVGRRIASSIIIAQCTTTSSVSIVLALARARTGTRGVGRRVDRGPVNEPWMQQSRELDLALAGAALVHEAVLVLGDVDTPRMQDPGTRMAYRLD